MKLFQITDDDLADLEKTLPELSDALTPTMDGALRTKLRRCQLILSRVRWGYGPPENVTVIPADDPE